MRTNHLNLLLVLVLVLFPMSTRAYGADECVMLYTPYTKIAVPPGESINYSVDVINNCDDEECLYFRLRNAARLEV